MSLHVTYHDGRDAGYIPRKLALPRSSRTAAAIVGGGADLMRDHSLPLLQSPCDLRLIQFPPKFGSLLHIRRIDSAVVLDADLIGAWVNFPFLIGRIKASHPFDYWALVAPQEKFSKSVCGNRVVDEEETVVIAEFVPVLNFLWTHKKCFLSTCL